MTDQRVGWKFEVSESGDGEGLNDGGVESFRDDHLLSLAKECAQNSLDARKDKLKPVVLEFNTFHIKPKDFPDIEQYKEIIDLQIKYWKNTQNDKTSEEFFKEAKETLNSQEIFCLRISDFNTTGLEGSRDGRQNPFSSWFKLVRSKGVTDNKPLAGGSFGLGKFATFACSKLRTVIYDTTDIKGIEAHQGVSILASYDTKKGERTKGKGYFCNLNDFSSIYGHINLDKKFSRRSSGTDIYILGFIDDDEELEDKLFSSILRSFLLAIYKGDLIFRLNGKSLEKDNLGDIIEKYRDEIYRPLISRETIEYYDILEGKIEFEECHFSIIENNDVSLKIAIGPGLCKKVGMFRNNGMKIFDKVGIRSYNDFVGILLLEGDKVNAYFRKLENPEHDNWRHERSNDPKEAKEKIRKLFGFITKNLKDLENRTLPESENIEGIDSLLDEDFEKAGTIPLEGLDFKPLRVRESKKQSKIRKIVSTFTGDGGPGKSNEHISKRGNGQGRSGPGNNNNRNAIIEILPKKIKMFQDKSGEYNLIFSLPVESNLARCEVFIGGEEGEEAIDVSKALIVKRNKETALGSTQNRILLESIEKDTPVHIKFSLKEDEKWALGVRFYEN